MCKCARVGGLKDESSTTRVWGRTRGGRASGSPPPDSDGGVVHITWSLDPEFWNAERARLKKLVMRRVEEEDGGGIEQSGEECTMAFSRRQCFINRNRYGEE